MLLFLLNSPSIVALGAVVCLKMLTCRLCSSMSSFIVSPLPVGPDNRSGIAILD